MAAVDETKRQFADCGVVEDSQPRWQTYDAMVLSVGVAQHQKMLQGLDERVLARRKGLVSHAEFKGNVDS